MRIDTPYELISAAFLLFAVCVICVVLYTRGVKKLTERVAAVSKEMGEMHQALVRAGFVRED